MFIIVRLYAEAYAFMIRDHNNDSVNECLWNRLRMALNCPIHSYMVGHFLVHGV